VAGAKRAEDFFLNLLQFPLPYGTANNPENVSKKKVFYKASVFSFLSSYLQKTP